MEYFLQQLINGLTLGAIYGLIAIGYTMVYGIIGMINFAHGEIYMIGAFIALISIMLLESIAGGSIIIALFVVLIISMVLTAIYGWALERVAYRPLRNSPRLAALISAIGMSIALGNYIQLTQGARNKTLQPVIRGNFELMARDDGFTVVLSALVTIDIAFFLEDARQFHLEARRGHIDFVVSRPQPITEAGQHVSYRIGHLRLTSIFERRSATVITTNSTSRHQESHRQVTGS